MLRSPLLAAAFGLTIALALHQSAEAQMLFGNSYKRSSTTATLNWLYNRPTVSPYVNLSRTDNYTRGATNYQRMVRPQLEARRQAELQQMFARRAQMQRAVGTLKTQLAMGAPTPTGRNPQQPGPMPTGHITESMSYLHFYPQLQQPNRRR